MIDLATLSLSDLKSLQAALPAEIERREKEARLLVKQELENLASERGFKLADFAVQQPSDRHQEKSKRAVAPKYRHPTQAGLTWTGRGRQPKWVSAFIAEGGALDSIRID